MAYLIKIGTFLLLVSHIVTSVSLIAQNKHRSIDVTPFSSNTDQGLSSDCIVLFMQPLQWRAFSPKTFPELSLDCLWTRQHTSSFVYSYRLDRKQGGWKVAQCTLYSIQILSFKEIYLLKDASPENMLLEIDLNVWKTKTIVHLRFYFELKPIGLKHGLTRGKISQG